MLKLARFAKMLVPVFIVMFTVGAVYADEGHCLTGSGVIKDETSPYTITVPAGNVITELAVKTGVEKVGDETPFCDYYGIDLDTDCYLITGGVGSNSVTVVKNPEAEGPDCKDISHIEVRYGGQGGGNGGQGGGTQGTVVTEPASTVTPATPPAGQGGGPAVSVLPQAGLEIWILLGLVGTALVGARLLGSSRKE